MNISKIFWYKNFEIENKPLQEYIDILNEIISNYGYGNLIDTLKVLLVKLSLIS